MFISLRIHNLDDDARVYAHYNHLMSFHKDMYPIVIEVAKRIDYPDLFFPDGEVHKIIRSNLIFMVRNGGTPDALEKENHYIINTELLHLRYSELDTHVNNHKKDLVDMAITYLRDNKINEILAQ